MPRGTDQTRRARHAAIAAYAFTLSFDWAADISGVPKARIVLWHRSSPAKWDEACNAVLTDLTGDNLAVLERIREITVRSLQYQLIHGEPRVDDRTGKTIIVPLSPECVAEIVKLLGDDLGTQPGLAWRH